MGLWIAFGVGGLCIAGLSIAVEILQKKVYNLGLDVLCAQGHIAAQNHKLTSDFNRIKTLENNVEHLIRENIKVSNQIAELNEGWIEFELPTKPKKNAKSQKKKAQKS